MATEPLDVLNPLPCDGEDRVVVWSRPGDRGTRLFDDSLRIDVGVERDVDAASVQGEQGVEALEAVTSHYRLRFRENANALERPPGVRERGGERDGQLEPPRIAIRKQITGSSEQFGRCGNVAPCQSSLSGGGETSARLIGQRVSLLPERSAVPITLLEVVADDLFELRVPAGCSLLHPRRKALMQFGAQFLGCRLVGRVTHEDVDEAKRIVAWEERFVWPDEVLAGEREEARRDPVSFCFGKQAGDGAAVEEPSFDGAPHKNGTLVGRQVIEARGEQGLNRRGHRDVPVPIFRRESEHLLDEERVSLGALADAVASSRREVRVGEEGVEERGRVQLAQRLELDNARAGPVRACVEELGPGGAHDNDRRPCEPDEVLDEVEERRLGPVDVVDDRDERPVARQSLEEDAGCPEDLLRACGLVGRADCTEEALCCDMTFVLFRQQLGQPGAGIAARGLSHDLSERPVGDALPIGKAAADDHASPISDGRDQLTHQT
jgi:hypothetical protein